MIYYDKAGIALHHGDCRVVLPALATGSVDIMLTSPPYDDARAGAYPGILRDDLELLAREVIRLLKPGGVALWVVDGPVNDGARSTLPFDLICRWSRLEGWRFLECLIYGRHGAPGAYAGRFRKDHEYMPVFVRDGATHTCNKHPLATRAAYDSRKHRACMRNRDGYQSFRRCTGWAAENGMTMPGTIWEYGCVGVAGTTHPATFPERLVRDVLACFSEPGDLMLDPFCGSGTTLRVAKDLGRRAIGVEIEEKWCDHAVRRLGQDVLPFADATTSDGAST